MKKTLVWIVSITLLILLTIRLFKKHIDDVESERHWYIEQLDFEISGEIDTIRSPKNILFHVTNGNLDIQKEENLRSKLNHSRALLLLRHHPNGYVDLRVENAQMYKAGDSIYLNTNKNIVRIYRDNRLIFEKRLLKSLRGRPF